MTFKWKKALRQQQSTRALMGIRRITDHGVVTASGERVFYLIRPDNLSVLWIKNNSPPVLSIAAAALTMPSSPLPLSCLAAALSPSLVSPLSCLK